MDKLILKHSFTHKGHRTAKMVLSKDDDMIKVWLSLGEKSCMIKLDRDNVGRLRRYLDECSQA